MSKAARWNATRVMVKAHGIGAVNDCPGVRPRPP